MESEQDEFGCTVLPPDSPGMRKSLNPGLRSTKRLGCCGFLCSVYCLTASFSQRARRVLEEFWHCASMITLLVSMPHRCDTQQRSHTMLNTTGPHEGALNREERALYRRWTMKSNPCCIVVALHPQISMLPLGCALGAAALKFWAWGFTW